MCMCVSTSINPVFNLSSNLSTCFHQLPNPFALFITFKTDNGVEYKRGDCIIQIALALGNIVCQVLP